MTDNVLDPENYVTVGKFMQPTNAQMAKGMLESAGIECFLQGENANNLLAYAFRVRLQVHRKDEEIARQMLAETGDELTDDALKDDALTDGDSGALGSGDE